MGKARETVRGETSNPSPRGVCRLVGGPFSRSDPDYQASMWGHMSRGQNLIWVQESFPGGPDIHIKNFHQDKEDRYGGEGGRVTLNTRGS